MARRPPSKATKPAKKNGRAPRRGATATDEPVDLGDQTAVSTGEALAVRDMAAHAAEDRATAAAAVSLGRGRAAPRRTFRQLLRDSFDIREVRRTPYGLTPVVVLSTSFFFLNMNATAFRIAGPEIARALEINVNDLVSLLVTIGAFGIFARLYAGWWADRHSRVAMLGVGTIVAGVFGAISGRARSYLSLSVPRSIGEVGDSASEVPIFSLLADYYPVETRGRVFSFLASLGRIGRLVSIFVVGALVTKLGWRWAVGITGACIAGSGVLLLLRLREPIRGFMERQAVGASDEVSRTEDEPQSFGEAWRATWAIRTLRRLFISDMFSAVGDTVVGLFYPFFLAEIYGLNAWERSLISIPSILAALAGGFIGGGLIDNFTRRNPSRVLVILGLFQLGGIVPVIGFAFEPHLAILVVLNAVNAFGFALVGPASNVVYSQVIPPTIRTQGLQVTFMAVLPSFVLVDVVFGLMFRNYGYPGLFLLTLPFGIIGAIVAISASGFFDLDVRSSLASSIASDEWRRTRAQGRGKLLVCRDIEVSYGNVQVLFNVDFDVEEGEIIALLGTNGAGKSTLLRAISGTTEAGHGAIVFDGRDITHMPSHEIVARGVVHMPGGRGVFPGLSVAENLMLANWLTEDPEEIRTRMAEIYEIFPILRERAEADAGSLSGGEQQQLSLAQAFLSKPRLLMIDELSLGLSPVVVAQLLDVVREIRRRGVTIIVVEQSVNVALTIAEKAIFMEKGEVKFFGKTADLLSRPDILRAVYVKGTGALTDGASAGAQRSERERRALSMESRRPILEVDGLIKRYGGVTAVDEVTFGLREGEVLGLVGPNGAGKTTIFDLISGFQIADAGRVRFEGVDITGLSPEARANRKLIRRFQDARLFPSLTVFEALLVALEQRLEVKNSLLNAAGAPNARRAERRLRVRADRLIDLLALGASRDKFVKELSTGLRRIVDLGCVLAAEPRVLLLDEPSSGIAQREAESLAPLLRRVRFETGCSILIIEHDMPLISSVADELIALDRGRVVIRGTPDEVLNDERVIESYLGTTEAAVRRSGSLR